MNRRRKKTIKVVRKRRAPLSYLNLQVSSSEKRTMIEMNIILRFIIQNEETLEHFYWKQLTCDGFSHFVLNSSLASIRKFLTEGK